MEGGYWEVESFYPLGQHRVNLRSLPLFLIRCRLRKKKNLKFLAQKNQLKVIRLKLLPANKSMGVSIYTFQGAAWI